MYKIEIYNKDSDVYLTIRKTDNLEAAKYNADCLQDLLNKTRVYDSEGHDSYDFALVSDEETEELVYDPNEEELER